MSAAAHLDFTYRYRFASSISEQDGSLGLRLATCGGQEPNPYFFEGRIEQPKTVSDALLTLSKVVRTHFFLPRPSSLDPVVTCGDDVLRLEGFSGCCGVYARVDFRSETFDTRIEGRGTTNVDFNNSMRVALAKFRQSRHAKLAVGTAELALQVDGCEVVEKKVKLPLRWIKCFCEVQTYLSGLRPRVEVKGPELLRFVRSLPRSGAGNRPGWVVPAGRGLRLSQVEHRGGVRVMGTDRLRVLENLAIDADRVRVWGDDGPGVSAWELGFETGRFLLVVSPELYRGFSGEGQVLETLAEEQYKGAIDVVRAQLKWHAHVEVGDVSRQCGLSEDRVTSALVALGARGLVGYDLVAGKYFHRELPFDLGLIEDLQPRLKDARKLIAENKVRIHKRATEGLVEIFVQGSDVEHLVRLTDEQDRCTCPWFSKYQGDRGPCKHVLAARLFVQGENHDG